MPGLWQPVKIERDVGALEQLDERADYLQRIEPILTAIDDEQRLVQKVGDMHLAVGVGRGVREHARVPWNGRNAAHGVVALKAW